MSPEFKYGVTAGLGVSLWTFGEYALGWHTTHSVGGELAGYFSNLILLACLVLLFRRKRARAPQGRLSFASALGSGLATSFLAAMIVYGLMVVYGRWIDPDWVDNFLAAQVARMRADQISEIEIRRAITFFRNANSTAGLLATRLLALTVTGGLFSLLLLVFQHRLKSRSAQSSRSEIS